MRSSGRMTIIADSSIPLPSRIRNRASKIRQLRVLFNYSPLLGIQRDNDIPLGGRAMFFETILLKKQYVLNCGFEWRSTIFSRSFGGRKVR
jgi:hypothetical protein